MYYGCSCSFSYLIYSCPAISALWITVALQLHFASFQMYYGCPCSFISLHFRCIMAAASALWITAAPAASSRFISDVLWLLLQLQLSGLQLPCSLSSLDNSCPRSFILLRFRCIMAAPAASALWTTAALQLQLYGLQLPYGFFSLHFRCIMAAASAF